MDQQTGYAKQNKWKKWPFAVAALVIAVAVIAAVGMRSSVVRYSFAKAMLERGEYAKAQQELAQLGDYKDKAHLAEEAEKGLAYLDAQLLVQQGEYREALAIYESIGDFKDVQEKICEATYLLAVDLMEQGERKEACELFGKIEDYQDAAALLEQLKQYQLGWAYMVTEHYEDAAELFRALGEFQDAAQQAAECQRLAEVKATYEDGFRQFENEKWLDAYRILLSIRDAEYKDTSVMLEEIEAAAEALTHYYAEQNERGKMLAFLRLTEEIDETVGAALREELEPAESFEADLSYWQFDPACLTACSNDTQAEQYMETLLYMILNGETELTLTSDDKLDKAHVLGNFYTATNMLGEIVPDKEELYEIRVTAGDHSMEIKMNYLPDYSEQRMTELTKLYEAFCEESVRELVESGLLSASMSRKNRAEIISEWVGFYMSYDRTLEVRIAGVGVEDAKGVCATYTALYHRMCNLAGIPTYGQMGSAGGAHIWVIHVDESGNIFYADPTWADSWDIDFSKEEEKPTVADFMEEYLARCMEGGIWEYKYPNYVDGAGQTNRTYLWAGRLWNSHEADRTGEEIIAMYEKLLGETR